MGRARSRSTTPSTTRSRLGADARGPAAAASRHRARRLRALWRVRQTIDDPEGHHDWVIDAVVDLDASDELGELVLTTTAFHRLGG